MLSFFAYVTLLCKAEEGDSEAIAQLEAWAKEVEGDK